MRYSAEEALAHGYIAEISGSIVADTSPLMIPSEEFAYETQELTVDILRQELLKEGTPQEIAFMCLPCVYLSLSLLVLQFSTITLSMSVHMAIISRCLCHPFHRQETMPSWTQSIWKQSSGCLRPKLPRTRGVAVVNDKSTVTNTQSVLWGIASLVTKVAISTYSRQLVRRMWRRADPAGQVAPLSAVWPTRLQEPQQRCPARLRTWRENSRNSVVETLRAISLGGAGSRPLVIPRATAWVTDRNPPVRQSRAVR
jgi:hypothetical protein